MMWFVIGLFVGAFVGIMCIVLCQASGHDRDD